MAGLSLLVWFSVCVVCSSVSDFRVFWVLYLFQAVNVSNLRFRFIRLSDHRQQRTLWPLCGFKLKAVQSATHVSLLFSFQLTLSFSPPAPMLFTMQMDSQPSVNVLVWMWCGQTLCCRRHISIFQSVCAIDQQETVLKSMEQYFFLQCTCLHRRVHNVYTLRLTNTSKTSDLKHYNWKYYHRTFSPQGCLVARQVCVRSVQRCVQIVWWD